MKFARLLVLVALVLCAMPQAAMAYYNPSMGRFISRDPLQERGGVNHFAFAHSDPIGRIDPRGEREIPVEFNAFINGARRGHWLPEPGLEARSSQSFPTQDLAFASFHRIGGTSGSQITT